MISYQYFVSIVSSILPTPAPALHTRVFLFRNPDAANAFRLDFSLPSQPCSTGEPWSSQHRSGSLSVSQPRFGVEHPLLVSTSLGAKGAEAACVLAPCGQCLLSGARWGTEGNTASLSHTPHPRRRKSREQGVSARLSRTQA